MKKILVLFVITLLSVFVSFSQTRTGCRLKIARVNRVYEDRQKVAIEVYRGKIAKNGKPVGNWESWQKSTTTSKADPDGSILGGHIWDQKLFDEKHRPTYVYVEDLGGGKFGDITELYDQDVYGPPELD